MLRPTEHISSVWLNLIRDFLQYLPRLCSAVQNEEDDAEEASTSDQVPGIKLACFPHTFECQL